ncbi:hypothetical protein Taro_036746, partial [Colocasia esculenta]|nr:hypothetical protein [Colocasia esculenta]
HRFHSNIDFIQHRFQFNNDFIKNIDFTPTSIMPQHQLHLYMDYVHIDFISASITFIHGLHSNIDYTQTSITYMKHQVHLKVEVASFLRRRRGLERLLAREGKGEAWLRGFGAEEKKEELASSSSIGSCCNFFPSKSPTREGHCKGEEEKVSMALNGPLRDFMLKGISICKPRVEHTMLMLPYLAPIMDSPISLSLGPEPPLTWVRPTSKVLALCSQKKGFSR